MPPAHLSEICWSVIIDILYEEAEDNMAEHKLAVKRAPERPELDRLLEQAKTAELTDADLREQQVSFVYGNAPKDSRITKESAERAVGRIRVTPP